MINNVNFSTLKCGECKQKLIYKNTIWKCDINANLPKDPYVEPCCWIESDFYSIYYRDLFFITNANQDTVSIIPAGKLNKILEIDYVSFIISNRCIDIEAMFSRYIKLLAFA